MPNSQQPIIFRNSWLMIGMYLALGAASAVIALCSVMMVVYEWFMPKHQSFWTIFGGVQWAGGAYCFALMGLQMWRTGVRTAHYQARLDSRGVDFRLGTKKKPITQFFGWDEIAAIMHKRQPMSEFYAGIGKDKRSVTFTIFTFFRPKKLARLIAAQSGRTIQDF